jgi:ABC-type phosphate transport system substrate-binding protein
VHRLVRAFLSLAVVCLVAAGPSRSPLANPPTPEYQIVVHPEGPAALALDARFIADVFLRKVKTWPNGESIRPVDLEPGSPVRRRFTEAVLRRPVVAVRAYWQQRIFSGRDVPPPELATDAAVVQYVARHVGAIGYVSASAASDGARAVAVR